MLYSLTSLVDLRMENETLMLHNYFTGFLINYGFEFTVRVTGTTQKISLVAFLYD